MKDFEVLEDLKRSSTVPYSGCGKRCTLVSISQFRRVLNGFWPEFHNYYLIGGPRVKAANSPQIEELTVWLVTGRNLFFVENTRKINGP